MSLGHDGSEWPNPFSFVDDFFKFILTMKRKPGPCPCRLLCFHVEYSIHHICLRKIGILFAGVTVLNQNETMFLAKKSYQNGRVNEKILRFRKGPVFWHGVSRGANDAGAVHDNHLGGRGVSAGSWLLRQSMAILNGKMKDPRVFDGFWSAVNISHMLDKSPSKLHGGISHLPTWWHQRVWLPIRGRPAAGLFLEWELERR